MSSTAVLKEEFREAQRSLDALNQGYKDNGKAALADVLEGLKAVPEWRQRIADAMFISKVKVNNIAMGGTRTPDVVEKFRTVAQELIAENLTEKGWELSVEICKALNEPAKSMREKSRKRRFVDLRCVFCLLSDKYIPLLSDQRIATMTGMERSMVTHLKVRGNNYLQTKEDVFTEKYNKAAVAVAEWAKRTIEEV